MAAAVIAVVAVAALTFLEKSIGRSFAPEFLAKFIVVLRRFMGHARRPAGKRRCRRQK
jgi:hypothetical protein